MRALRHYGFTIQDISDQSGKASIPGSDARKDDARLEASICGKILLLGILHPPFCLYAEVQRLGLSSINPHPKRMNFSGIIGNG
jgi:hypothetical protein